MSALRDLLMVLEGMVAHNVPDAQQALQLAQKVQAEEYTPEAVLEAVLPGTRVRDSQGDIWRKRKRGDWTFKRRHGGPKYRLHSKQLLHVWGPVQVLPWDGAK